MFLPSWGRIPGENVYGVALNETPRNSPWFAMAFSAGQEHLLSPSLGAIYSGHFPPAPGYPSGVTCPILRWGDTRLTRVNKRSHVKTKRSWKILASEVKRNMVLCEYEWKLTIVHGPVQKEKRKRIRVLFMNHVACTIDPIRCGLGFAADFRFVSTQSLRFCCTISSYMSHVFHHINNSQTDKM